MELVNVQMTALGTFIVMCLMTKHNIANIATATLEDATLDLRV
jgi:hypothetical protein